MQKEIYEENDSANFDASEQQAEYARLAIKPDREHVYYPPEKDEDEYFNYDDSYDDYVFPDDMDDVDRWVDKTITYEPFTPERELKEVRKLRGAERRLPQNEQRAVRRNRLHEFKSQLEHQRAGIAHTIDALYEKVHENPDGGDEVLWQMLEEAATTYRLDLKQLTAFARGVDAYTKKHAAVEKYRAKYPNDSQLYEACFGMIPVGKVEVVKGPMTLSFRCFDLRDYASIYEDKVVNELVEDDISGSDRSMGFALPGSRIEDLDGTLTVEKVTETTTDAQSHSTLLHEEQHQFNKLFNPTREMGLSASHVILRLVEDEVPLQEALPQLALAKAHQSRRWEGVDDRARDEILAFYRDGSTTDQIFYTLHNSPLYNYYGEYDQDRLAELKDDIAYEITSEVEVVLPDLQRAELKLDDTTLQMALDTAFVTDYKKDLRKWTDILSGLEEKGYTRNEIVALLYQEPTHKWAALARRLPEKL